MKKLVSIITAAGIMLGVSGLVLAQNNPSVYINGNELAFTDAKPFIENDRTLVPMRAIFEAMDTNIYWDEKEQTVHGVKKNEDGNVITISIQIGSVKAFKGLGEATEEISLDVPAKIVNDRTFVPLRFVAEALDAEVEWNHAEYSVEITK